MSTPTTVGTRRRIRALGARGWGLGAIAREAGVTAGQVHQALIRLERTTPEIAGRVAAAYDRVWDRPPPAATEAERAESDEVLQHAQGRGWPVPLAWDDDEIDQEDARPAAGWRPTGTTQMRAADLVEDAEFVREHGGYRLAPAGEVAMRLGVSRDRLEHAQARQRRYAARDMEAEAG